MCIQGNIKHFYEAFKILCLAFNMPFLEFILTHFDVKLAGCLNLET
jgi:hypothetical protein